MVRKVGSDLAQSLRQQAAQVNLSGFQTLSNLNQSFSEKSQQILQSQIAENRAVAESSSRIAQSGFQASQQRSQEREALFGAVNQGLQTFQQVELNKQKFQQAEREQLGKQEFVQAFTELSQLTTGADQFIKERGEGAFIQTAFDTLGQYQNISQEDRVKLIDQTYKARGRVNQEIFTKTQKHIEQVNNSVKDAKQAELNIALSGISARISTGNFADIGAVLGEADTKIAEFLTTSPSLNDLQRLEIYANTLSNIADNSEAGIAHKVQIQAKADSYKNLLSDPRFGEIVNRSRQGNASSQEWELSMMTLSEEYGIPLGNVRSLGDPLGTEKQVIERQEINQKLDALHRQGIARDISKADVDKKAIAFYAYAMTEDPGLIFELEAVDGFKDNPRFKTMIELRDTVAEYRETKQKVSLETTKIDKAIAIWGQAELKNLKSVDDANNKSQDLLSALGQMGRDDLVANLTQKKESIPSNLPDDVYIKLMADWYQKGFELLHKEKAIVKQELQPLARKLNTYGMLEAVDTDNGQLLQNDFKNIQDTIKQSYNAAPNNAIPGGQQGNFNNGSIRSNTSFASIADPRDGKQMTVPFRADVASQLRISSSRGERVHPIRGTKSMHSGVDIAVPMGTPIVFYDQGVVDAVKTDPNGYGFYTDIRTPDNKIHRFAHMKNQTKLKVGQTVSPGTEIGLAGSSGGSTGSHLHWEIRSSERRYGYDGTYDVEALAKDYNGKISTTQPRGDNLAMYSNLPNPYTSDTLEKFIQNTAPRESLITGARNYIVNGMYGTMGDDSLSVNATSVYNMSRPYTNKNVRYDKANFTVEDNKPDNNYGYSALAKNPNYSKKLNEVASRLGMPGYWLADIIAFESKFNTNIDQSAGLPYSGLIQFGDAAAERMGTSRDALKRMGFEEQMEYVYKYFNFPEFRGQLTSVDKVLAAVWGGRGLIDKINANPKNALNVGDGFINFKGYLSKLGKDAGRRYDIPYMNGRKDRVVSSTHSNFVQGCPICNQLKQGNSFVTHKGSIS